MLFVLLQLIIVPMAARGWGEYSGNYNLFLAVVFTRALLRTGRLLRGHKYASTLPLSVRR
jgi:hypothetical protein